MSTLHVHLREYLRLRHQLGFKVRVQELLLRQFVRFAAQQNATLISTSLVLRWISKSASMPAERLSAVRQFAQYVSCLDSRTEIPRRGLLPHHFRRPTPYIYRDEEVHRLVQTAGHVQSPKGLKGATLSTLFGLLAVTGMRVGEAIGLDRSDVDFNQSLIIVHRAKGNTSRLVPLHPSTRGELESYAQLRDQICSRPSSLSFFISEEGHRLLYCTINYWFLRICRQIGLRGANDRPVPRLHELRHRFAIKTMLAWYSSNANVEIHLPELATYLGHIHVRDTYWYLSAVPELLQLVTKRLQRIQGDFYA
jgi:integrase/recombinase XerD